MKSITAPLVLLGLLTALSSCAEHEANEQRYATLDAVDRDTVPVLKEFRALFPKSTIQYLSFAGAEFPSLSADATLQGRYTLNMRLPVFYSEDNKSVLRYGEPKFFLCEITRIQMEGATMRSYDAGDQWHFGGAEWKRAFGAGGDFSVVGYKLKKDAPVENFGALEAATKERSRAVAIQAESGMRRELTPAPDTTTSTEP